ncbi:alpha/beta hydrolase [Azospirillum sp. B4]|uniref:alpha/beta hydrolase n=1 Tax=Azospirillum sp. B4 TaxID=95605 RepID=UPI00034A2D4B|nr:alpha/beta hydrolase [Azospirillum sp. B4]
MWSAQAPLPPDWPGKATRVVVETTSADGQRVINVTDPTYQAYLPAPDRATGAAAIIAPGGGFRFLAIRNEGTAVAEWLAGRGVAAFVLKYRVVQQDGSEEETRRKSQGVPVEVQGAPGVADGIQALKRIRDHARDYGIDPHRVAAIGFSAGAHVVSMMALAPDAAARPDYVAPIYGGAFTSGDYHLPPANLPPEPGTPTEPWLAPPPKPAPGRLPPFFLAMAQDDVFVGQGVRRFYDALFAAGYRPELHLYFRGNHGFGMKPQGSTSDHFLQEFLWWLEAQGATRTAPP